MIQTCCPPFSFRCRSPGVRRVRASPGAVRGRCPVRTLGRRGKHQAAACSPSLLHYSLLPLTSTWLPRRGSQGKSTTESPFGFAIVPPSVPFGDSSPSRGELEEGAGLPPGGGTQGGRRPLEIRPEGELNSNHFCQDMCLTKIPRPSRPGRRHQSADWWWGLYCAAVGGSAALRMRRPPCGERGGLPPL